MFASPNYLKQHNDITEVDDLEQHTVIGYLHNQPANILIFQSASGVLTHKLVNCRVKSVTGLVDLACKGLGIVNAANDDTKIQRALKQGELVPILSEYWCENVSTYVYYHQVKGEQAKVRAFIDFFISQRKYWE